MSPPKHTTTDAGLHLSGSKSRSRLESSELGLPMLSGGIQSALLLRKVLLLVVLMSFAGAWFTPAAAQPTSDNNFYHIEYRQTGRLFEMSCSDPTDSLNCACPEVNRLYKQDPFPLGPIEDIILYNDSVARYCCNHEHCCINHLVKLCRNYTHGGCSNRTRTPVRVIRECPL